MKNVLIIIICISISGCATKTKTRYAIMGSAATVGAAVGYATTKKGDSKQAHAALWASAFGLAAAVVGNYLYNNDAEVSKLKKENELLKTPRLELIDEDTAYYTYPSLKNGKKKKVKVRTYKTDRWVEVDDNTVFHQDMKLERIPVEKE